MKTIKRLNLTRLWLSVSYGNSPITFDWSVEVDLGKPFKFVELPSGRIGFTQLVESIGEK
jgi:hypothetical protein